MYPWVFHRLQFVSDDIRHIVLPTFAKQHPISFTVATNFNYYEDVMNLKKDLVKRAVEDGNLSELIGEELIHDKLEFGNKRLYDFWFKFKDKIGCGRKNDEKNIVEEIKEDEIVEDSQEMVTVAVKKE